MPEAFVAVLRRYRAEALFNPWGELNPQHDLDGQGAVGNCRAERAPLGQRRGGEISPGVTGDYARGVSKYRGRKGDIAHRQAC
jgi:hypothetical protein